MAEQEIWRLHADRLLKEISAKGQAVSSELKDAYWAAPRHYYIGGLFDHDPSTSGWREVARPDNADVAEAWLQQIYQDLPLVVRIDDAGFPCCSNSAPSLVFRMLGCLDPSVGDHVLEIGTGTGQVAAMLGHLVGPDGTVVSLEVGSSLAAAARHRLACYTPGVPVTIADTDARCWMSGDAKFDAVVATASCWPVPQGWLTALAPGGRLWAEMRGGLSGAVLMVCRKETRSEVCLGGTFDDEPANFMPMRTSESVPEVPLELPYGLGYFDCVERVPADGLGVRELGSRHPFAWYCQLEVPDAHLIWLPTGEGEPPEPLLLADGNLDAVGLPVDGTSADSQLVSYGDTSGLLARITSSWRRWNAMGSPTRGAYSFGVDDNGEQWIRLERNGQVWRI